MDRNRTPLLAAVLGLLLGLIASGCAPEEPRVDSAGKSLYRASADTMRKAYGSPHPAAR